LSKYTKPAINVSGLSTSWPGLSLWMPDATQGSYVAELINVGVVDRFLS
jgi:hypothetical protein